MYIKLSCHFREYNLRNYFLVETIFKKVYKDLGFVMLKYFQVNDKEICFLFEKKGSFEDLNYLHMILDYIPGDLGINMYGWSIGILPIILKDVNQYKVLNWDYKHGECYYKFN